MSRSYQSAKRAHAGGKPSFALDGVEFTCEGGVSTLDISEFAVAARDGLDTDDPRAAAVFADFFRNTLGPREYQRFRDHTRAHETDDELLLDIMKDLIEDFLGRPTKEPSHLQDGPSSTGHSSRVVSLQRGSVQIIGEKPGRDTPMGMTSSG